MARAAGNSSRASSNRQSRHREKDGGSSSSSLPEVDTANIIPDADHGVAGHRRQRRAATAAIQRVMDKYNIAPTTDNTPSTMQHSDNTAESIVKEPCDLKQTTDHVQDKLDSITLTSRNNKKDVSTESTPSTSSSGTPRSETPDVVHKCGKVASSKRSKGGKRRRRIRTMSDADSEDSEKSTDSPLKPKTYSEKEEGQEETTVNKPTLRSTRIPKKTKPEVKVEAKSEPTAVDEKSPVEEEPLMPKGYLHRKETDSKPVIKQEQETKVNLVMSVEDKTEVDKRIKSFKQLKENHYLCKKIVNKQSKKMQCDCVVSKEELQQGEKGCGDDCLNRLLYIECGKSCLLETNCSNKRFQNNQYADVEVFKTEWKGVGLRARSFIPKDTFIMEYVGEVLDTRLFKKRAKQYAKDNVQHFYFMALSKDQFVDATCKGNISRFINHSCDPNSETQKWTVNGELRVGFFTKRAIKPGEEVSFDYKYERYGNVAQKCYCGSSQCRGWLGGEPGGDSGLEEEQEWSDDDEDEEDLEEEAVRKERKKKVKRKDKKVKKFEVDDTEEELEKLMVTGIRNKVHTLQLCRVMVRADRVSTRLKLADLIFEAPEPCLRLFLDYQGLRILYTWMYELQWSIEELELKLRIESVLGMLPVPHKTILVDSKVMQTIDRWSKECPQTQTKDEGIESAPVSRAASPSHRDNIDGGQAAAMDVDTPSVSVAASPSEDLCPPGEEAGDKMTVEDSVPPAVDNGKDALTAAMTAQAGVGAQSLDTLELEDVSMDDISVKPVTREDVTDQDDDNITLEERMVGDIQERAKELLEQWSGLQEMFKIPKKERQAERREHERAADRGSHRDRDDVHGEERRDSRHRLSVNSQSYSRDRDTGVMRGGHTESVVSRGNRKNLRLDDRTGRLSRANLYRDDRRMLFQAKVEEEQRQKVLRQAVAARHNQCCRLLGLDPATTPLLPRYPEFYFAGNKWVPMPEPPLPVDPSWTTPRMAALPPEAFRADDPPLPNPRSVYPPGCCPEPDIVPETSPQQSVSLTVADICAHYDKLYYGDNPVPPPSDRRVPSNVPQREQSPLSEAISAQLDRPSSDDRRLPSNDLSPDYRSPSPAPVSRSSPPTSVQFLSSSPPVDTVTVLQAAHSDHVTSDHDQAEQQPMAGQETHGHSVVVSVPPKWRAVRDGSGRVYYYNIVTRQTQWEVPVASEEDTSDSTHQSEDSHRMETNESESDGAEDDDNDGGEDTDTEEDSEEEDAGAGGGEADTVSEIADSDLSSSEKRMLLRMRRRTKEERRRERRMKREKFKERHEHERQVTRERHKRHRRDGLVEEHLVPARIHDKDKLDLMTFKEMRERLLNKDKIREQQLKEEREEEERERREERAKVDKIRREERRAAEKAKREADIKASEDVLETSVSSTPDTINVSLNLSLDTPTMVSTTCVKSKTTQAAADTSSDSDKKHKDKFLKEMSKVIVKILDPYRKKGVRGHIGNTDDFRHLAKKLTYSILHKELKSCKSIEELKPNEKVIKKAKEYVGKYMKKYEREYKRSPNQAE